MREILWSKELLCFLIKKQNRNTRIKLKLVVRPSRPVIFSGEYYILPFPPRSDHHSLWSLPFWSPDDGKEVEVRTQPVPEGGDLKLYCRTRLMMIVILKFILIIITMFYFPAMATQCLQWVGENLEFLLTRMVLTLMLPGDGDSDADIFIRGGDGSTEESSHIKSSSQGPSNKHPHPSPPHSSWPGLQLIFSDVPHHALGIIKTISMQPKAEEGQ